MPGVLNPAIFFNPIMDLPTSVTPLKIFRRLLRHSLTTMASMKQMPEHSPAQQGLRNTM